MAVNQTIGAISTAPQLGVDTKEVFVEKAETVWGELKLRVPELNTAFSQVNTTEASINAKEASAVASASAAANSALVATASANFKGSWSSATAYTVGQSVLGADNAFYVCLVAHTNQNPTSTSGYWKVNVPIGAIGNINSPLLDMPLKNSLAMKAGVGSATFTRASTATYIDRYGVLKTAAIDEPRFEKEGYLNEGASTNLNTYSEDASTSYNYSGSTNVSNTDLAPDGNVTADKLLEDTSTGFHHNAKAYTVTAGQVYTVSRFIMKTSTETSVKIDLWNPTDMHLAYVIFNPSTGTVASSLGKYSIDDYGSYYRISLTATPTITSIFTRMLLGSGSSYTGDGTTYIIHWGLQLEALPFATSYIPTVASAVTRAADSLTLSADGNYNLPADKKTIILDYDILGYGSVHQTLFDLTTTSQYNRILSFAPTASAPAQRAGCYYSGTFLAFSATAMATNTKHRLGYLLPTGTATQNLTRYLNGVYFATTSQTIVTNSAPTTLYIGRANWGTTNNHFGHISNVRVYDKALSATEIALA